jgi:hypothetical protein
MFTTVALGIITVARWASWINGAPAPPRLWGPLPLLRRDPVPALILSFAVFMLTAVLAPAISENPAMLYPVLVIRLAAAMALVWPALRGII